MLPTEADDVASLGDAILAATDEAVARALGRALGRRYDGRALEELADRLKLHRFDTLLYNDLAAAARVADFLVALGEETGRPRIAALGLLARADAARRRGHPAQAMALFDEAARRYRVVEDEVGWARARGGWVAAAAHAGHITLDDLAGMDEACRVLREAGQIYRLAMVRQNIGWGYQVLGLHREALGEFDRALADAAELDEDEGRALRAMLLANRAYSLQWMGRLKESVALRRQALDLFTRCGMPGVAALVAMNLAVAERLRWHLHDALRASRAALDGLRAANQPLALALTHHAEILLDLNRIAEAAGAIAEAVARLRELDTPIDLAYALGVLARVRARRGEDEAALDAVREGERLAIAAGVREEAHTLRIAGAALLLAHGRAGEARAAALGVLRAPGSGETRVHRAMALLVCAEAALQLGEETTAARQARAVIARGTAHDLPEASFRGHALLARLARRRGDSAHALQEYDGATAILLRLSDELAYDRRSGFLEDKDALYLEALATALEAGDPARALLYLEQARARAAWRMSLERDPAIDALRARHRSLSALVPALGAGTPEAARARAELRDLGQQLQDAMEDRAERATAAGPLGAPALPRGLPADVVALAYACAGDDLVTFTLAGGEISAVRLDGGARQAHKLGRILRLGLDAWAQRLAACDPRDAPAVARRSERELREPLAALWALLIAPVAGALPAEGGTLTLIPHGTLHSLPLAALHDGGRYLIERWTLRCVPSCLALTRRAPAGAAPGAPALALGYGRGDTLPHAAEEAHAVARLLGGDAWVGDAAAGERLLAEGAGRPILHLAAHGAMRPESPLSSFVDLADGPMHPTDVALLDLRGCRLVTLSACQTGLGRPSGGDEQIGLTRSFALAGAEAVLASLWRVGDAATSALMRRLYARLATGAPAAHALRAAQLDFLHGEEATRAHPYAWAGFQLVEHSAPATVRVMGGTAEGG